LGLFCIKGLICRGFSTGVEGSGPYPAKRTAGKPAKRTRQTNGGQAAGKLVYRISYCVMGIVYVIWRDAYCVYRIELATGAVPVR